MFITNHIAVKAVDYKTKATYYNHLLTINKEWKYHKNACPKGEIAFDSDEERIALHLKLVCNELVKSTPQNLTKKQKTERYKLILSLLEYAQNKIFPINLYHPHRQPYFIDHRNVHCAVGYLMQQSGNEKLAQQIKLEHNYDYIKNITTDGVVEWGINYGFLVEELKWIQPAYPQNNFQPILDGTNNAVKVVHRIPATNQLLIAGDFSSINNLPCLQIGVYDNNQFSCLGNGLSGKINGISNNTNFDIMAYGTILNVQDTFPFAIFSNNQWDYVSVPNRVGATATKVFNGGYIEIALNHSSKPNRQELWYYQNSNWQLVAEVSGEIYDIKPSYLGRIYAGHFDSVFVYSNNVITDTIVTNNVIVKENYSSNWNQILSNDIPDTVKTIQVIGNSIYFGGSCNNTNEVCLTQYLNGVTLPLIQYSTLYSSNVLDVYISKILYNSSSANSELFIAGNFIYPTFNGVSSHLIKYNLITDELKDFGFFDSTVIDMAIFENSLFVGGYFTENLGTPLNYIAKTYDFSAVENKTDNNELLLYPNPCSNILNIHHSDTQIKEIQIYDAFGKRVYSVNLQNKNNYQIDISTFHSGVYTITVINHLDRKIIKQFIKV